MNLVSFNWSCCQEVEVQQLTSHRGAKCVPQRR